MSQPFRLGTVRPISYHQEAGIGTLSDACKNPDDIFDALHRPKVGNMDQDSLVIRSVFLPQTAVNGPSIDVAIDEIRHHFHAPFNL